MSPVTSDTPAKLPTHLDLPDHDGENVINGFERPQTNLLLEPLRDYLLRTLHTDGNFFLGGDVGFYWELMDPPLAGCKCPDVAYVPNVPPMLDGTYRRSYVMWQELVSPMFLAEFVCDADGSEERDPTPNSGKFWVYERALKSQYYAIYEPDEERLELFEVVRDRFRGVGVNRHGRYPLPLMGLELGLWEGEYEQVRCTFMRFFTPSGEMLPTEGERRATEADRAKEAKKALREERRRARAEAKKAEEAEARAEVERLRAEAERQRAEAERQRAERLRERLRQFGIDPDAP